MSILVSSQRTLLALAVSSLLLAACTASPLKPEGAVSLRSRLTALQSDPMLAKHIPLALVDADVAVAAAEQPQADSAVGAHLVFMADRRIEIARALAESRLAVDQRRGLTEQREVVRLQARTREADAANDRAILAEADAGKQRAQAQAARLDTVDAERNSQELQRQIEELQAKVTDRGLVLTLSDVLFTTGGAQLRGAESGNLGKLAQFLNKNPERTVMIEGHTDSMGSDDSNMALSQRRADAVKSYLVMREGIDSRRLTASGKGEGSPLTENESAQGRQQNRRVEVIIEDSPVMPRASVPVVRRFPMARQPVEGLPSL